VVYNRQVYKQQLANATLKGTHEKRLYHLRVTAVTLGTLD
jgi:hypothetical protein